MDLKKYLIEVFVKSSAVSAAAALGAGMDAFLPCFFAIMAGLFLRGVVDLNYAVISSQEKITLLYSTVELQKAVIEDQTAKIHNQETILSAFSSENKKEKIFKDLLLISEVVKESKKGSLKSIDQDTIIDAEYRILPREFGSA